MTDLSIIIPTFNRGLVLYGTLASVAAVVTSSDPVEIIVVDNGSTDNTAQACREVAQKFPGRNWRYFHESMPGLLSGRHRGALEAKGEVLAFLDDDVLLAPTWLEALQSAFRDPEAVLVGGPSSPHYEVEPPAWLTGLWVEFEHGRRLGFLSLIEGGSSVRIADPLYVWGLNFAIRKSVFERFGGFHPDCVPKALQRYQGDGETGLTFKIKAAGFKALYHPQAALRHIIPVSRMTLESFKQRGFYQGVCDSFTRIRAKGVLDTEMPVSWKDRVRPLKSKVYSSYLCWRRDALSIRMLWNRAYFEGFNFHQHQVRHDPKLLEWVLKSDYFDYRLPEGWQKYCKYNGAKQVVGGGDEDL